MNNTLANAEAHGAGVQDVVKVGIFTTKLDEASSINETYLSVIGDHRPARLMVEVSALPRQALVEIEMVVRVRD
jgi:2-iminobutanoate/2-iminopropanoate deaminase